MIAYLKGMVADVTEDNLVLDVNGIGYNIHISSNTARSVCQLEDQIKVYTYMSVREDAIQLYGFLTKSDLEMYKLLITVNGIGPKAGLSILNQMDGETLQFAILSGDSKQIAKAPGVGMKTAERVILDLKDKISIPETVAFEKSSDTSSNDKVRMIQKEVSEALISLGYSATESLKAVKQVDISEEATVEQVLKVALRKVSLL